jgi:hypothetical protein
MAIRNPLTTYTVIGGVGPLLLRRGWTPLIETRDRVIFLFAFSSSLIDDFTGNRAARRFVEAFDDWAQSRGGDATRAIVSRSSLALQFCALQAMLAGFALIVGVFVQH